MTLERLADRLGWDKAQLEVARDELIRKFRPTLAEA
jgi:hypothetical protein